MKEKSDRVVCLFQNLYEVLGKVHGNTHQHCSLKKTFEVISNQYTYILCSFVELYVARYTQYYTRRSFPALIVRKTIVSKKASAFLFAVFTIFGPPYILQSDNRREFTAQIIHELL
ncbi:29258_t:CDS:2, partial [Racocetra persica]